MSAANDPADIALQLWTVREEIEKDAAGTLRRIAEIGYPAVETAFFPESISISQAGQLLKEANLGVCSMHGELPVNEENKAAMLKMAEAYTCTRMVWHGWPEDPRYQTAEGTKELADIYNECLHFAKTNGLTFGIHNHWWEFEEHEDGHSPYKTLSAALDPEIFFELDTYWIKVAGHNPADIVRLFGDRAPLLHIKDGPAKWTEALDQDNPEPMVAVGKGSQDFHNVVQAADSSTEWMIVELDNCATDMMTAVAESYTYLTGYKLAKGRV